MTPYGSGTPLLIDSSAWFRQMKPDIRPRWEATLRARLLASCPVAALEIMTGARDEQDFADLHRAFLALPQAPVIRAACAAALSASRTLRGNRRLPAADYLIAAAAAERGFGVLHCDRHFEVLGDVLSFESVRVETNG